MGSARWSRGEAGERKGGEGAPGRGEEGALG